jgi:flavin-dependent dehydrogenase
VTRRALEIAAPALTRALDAVPVERAEFSDPRTRPAVVGLRDVAPGGAASLVVTDRRSFDEALLLSAVDAGARHVPSRVTDVEVTRAGALVRTRADAWPARFIVGADGANSLVRRRVSSPFRRDQLSIAAGIFAHGATSRTIHVRFVASPSGYIWSFPRRTHLAIGICARADESTTEQLRAILRDWLAETGIADGARLEAYGWPIPSLGPADFAAQRAAGDGWLLVGDAAGLVDPITREGIYFALESGGFAAEALCGSGDPARVYEDRLREQVYPELVRAARLQRGFFRGGFTRLLVDALADSAPVRRVMADLVAGEQPYRTLKRRLLATFEVGLAWRLLRLELASPRGTAWRGRLQGTT